MRALVLIALTTLVQKSLDDKILASFQNKKSSTASVVSNVMEQVILPLLHKDVIYRYSSQKLEEKFVYLKFISGAQCDIMRRETYFIIKMINVVLQWRQESQSLEQKQIKTSLNKCWAAQIPEVAKFPMENSQHAALNVTTASTTRRRLIDISSLQCPSKRKWLLFRIAVWETKSARSIETCSPLWNSRLQDGQQIVGPSPSEGPTTLHPQSPPPLCPIRQTPARDLPGQDRFCGALD